MDQPTGSLSPGSPGPMGQRTNEADPGRAAEQIGDTIGPYRLLSVLGEGGFGVVYLAERREAMVQRVALKIIKPGMDGRAVVARFEQERQALAVMDHPNVARVYDAGTTPQGRPYFVMEYVQGEPITAYCDRNTLGTRERLTLFVGVCEAVQHAHTKGIIHRDIKPSNVLVMITDGRPAPKVIDFGVAKAITRMLTEKTVYTEHGQVIGTPEYMSPEQAEMGATDIDTRTDVYSLGVLLYELLTGALPFDPRDLRSAGFSEIQRIIREVEPPRPSLRLSRLGDSAEDLARRRRTHAADLCRELHRELEWIPLKAMRKDRTQRYRTAAEMADDVRNYLDGNPLIAGPESAAYRVRKFLRRRRALVIGAAAVTLALLAGIIGTSVGLVRANHAAEAERAALKREQGEHARAEHISAFLHEMLSSVDPEKARGRDVSVKEILDDAASRVGDSFRDDPVAEASLRETLGETYHQLSRYDDAIAQFTIALTLREKSLGPNNRDTLTTRFNIGASKLSMRDVAGATAVLEETLEARRKAFGETDEDTLVTRSLVGFARQLAGDNEGALLIYRQTLDLLRKSLPVGAKPTLETMASIADVLQDLGRLEEAERTAADLAEAARAAQGPDGPTVLSALSIRASILNDLGKYVDAEALCREVLAAKTRIYGPEHSETLTTANVLALTLEQLKKYDEGAALLRSAADTAARTLGPDNAATLTYLGNLGRMEQLRGNLDEAEHLLRLVLDERVRGSGEEDTQTLVSMNNLGLLLLDRKKPVDAEPIFRRMLAGIEKALPADHWMRGQARLNVAECLIDQRRYDEAETLMLAGYDALTSSLPAGHPRIANAATAIATLYGKWGKPEKEADWRARAVPPTEPASPPPSETPPSAPPGS